MKKEEGLQLAKALKEKLLERRIPVRQVLLYGSVATGKTHKWSDVDIAVICDPFRPTRLEENVAVSKARWDIDLRIETVCLHPADLENKYSTIAQEVKRHGIPVE
jgi:predicted nucleotidyltransferase